MNLLQEAIVDDRKIDKIYYHPDKVEEARKYMKDTTFSLILPTDDQEELEKSYFDWMGQNIDKRRRTDWKSLELFGVTNRQMYDLCKTQFRHVDIIKDDIDNSLDTSIIEAVESDNEKVEYDLINYGDYEIGKAIDWSNVNNLALIVPTRSLEDLERLWDNYNSMLHKHKRVSDWASMNFFQMTNLQHYVYLKRKFLQQDIEAPDIEDQEDDSVYIVPDHASFIGNYVENCMLGEYSNQEIASVLYEANLYSLDNFYRASITKVTKKILEDDIISSVVDADFLPSGDLPYYTPDELLDMGVYNYGDPEQNFYNVAGDIGYDISPKAWFESYYYNFYGFDTPNRKELYQARLKRLTELCNELKLMKLHNKASSEDIKVKKQSILELGWNPEIEFTPENRVRVNELYKIRHHAHIKTEIVDMTGFTSYKTESIVEAKSYKGLKPVFIVLSSGKSAFSAAIKGITNSIYSHASISLDPDLKTMYSYNVTEDNGFKKIGRIGGFNIESIDKLDKDQNIAVFGVFVKDNDWKTIRHNLDWLIEHIQDTGYSFLNLFSFLFNSDMKEVDDKAFCSQFVDRMLKLIGIDITNKRSVNVAPGTFEKVSKGNNKIFKFYTGKVKRFNGSKVRAICDSLIKRNGNKVSYKEQILNIIRGKFDILSEVQSIDPDKFGPTMNKIYTKYVQPCMEATEYEMVDIESQTDSFRSLDNIIQLFGKH